jgi:hypothetical protein
MFFTKNLKSIELILVKILTRLLGEEESNSKKLVI